MTVSIDAAEAGLILSSLLERAAGGETISITERGREVARLIPPEHPPAPRPKPNREGGWMKGKTWMAPDFDETPQEIIDLFEGKESDL